MKSQTARAVVRLLAVILAAAAIWVSYGLTTLHKEPGKAASTQPAAKAATTQPAGEDNLFEAACTSVLSTSDCSAAVASPWGTVPFPGGRIPTALLGLWYYTALFFYFLLIGSPTRERMWVHVVTAALMAAGLGASVFFLYQMQQLEHPCSLCIITHAINAALFVCMLLLWPKHYAGAPAVVATESVAPAVTPAASDSLFASEPAPTPAPVPAAVAVVEPVRPDTWTMFATPLVILLAILAEAGLARPAHDLPTDVNALQKQLEGQKELADYYKKQFERYDSKWQHTYTAWALSPELRINTEDRPVRGPENARHTIVLFSDFQCPSCKLFENTVTNRIIPMAERFGGVRVIFKHWPICKDCNPELNTNLHPNACAAALAAEAARIVGGNEGFWKMHDILFNTQDAWKRVSRPNFEPYAAQIGLDVTAWKAALNSPEAMQRLQADIEEGRNMGKAQLEAGEITVDEQDAAKVDSTPAIFVNNKRLAQPRHVRTWQQIFSLQRAPAQGGDGAGQGQAPQPQNSTN